MILNQMIKKFLFSIIRIYIILVVWMPFIWVIYNFQDNEFLLLILSVFAFLLALGTIIYIAYYFKTENDPDTEYDQ